MEKPIYHEKFQLPDKTEIDRKLIVGAAIFGIGWGWAGICPGPAVLCFYIYLPQTIVFMIMLICGQIVENLFDTKLGNFINGIKEENNNIKTNEENTDNNDNENEQKNEQILKESILSDK